MNLHLVGAGGHSALACGDNLVAEAALGLHHALGASDRVEESYTLCLVVTELLLETLVLELFHECHGHLLCLHGVHEQVLLCNASDESSEEEILVDEFVPITEHLVTYTGDNLVCYLLTYLNTCIESTLLGIVAHLDTGLQTLDEVGHVKCINTHAVHDEVLQTLCLSQPHSIREGVDLSREISGRVTVLLDGSHQ